MKHNSGIPSAFQKAWDLYLKNSNIMLVIVGSSISMIQDFFRILKEEKNPDTKEKLCSILESMEWFRGKWSQTRFSV